MLGRSYVVLQRFADATKAYARANALSVEQPQAEWLVAAGAAQGMSTGQHDLTQSAPLFEQALKLEPGNVEGLRSEEHTSELQSLMRISYAVFCLKKKKEREIREAQV